jgi:hypothetical protein
VQALDAQLSPFTAGAQLMECTVHMQNGLRKHLLSLIQTVGACKELKLSHTHRSKPSARSMPPPTGW